MEVQVIDNFLPTKEFKQLQSFMMSQHVPWHYQDRVVGYSSYDTEMVDKDYDFQFCHCFYLDNQWMDHAEDTRNILNPTLQKLDPASLVRIKANMCARTPEKILHGFHVDHEELLDRMRIGVYYMNTNEGQTVFKNGKVVDSIANRMVLFDGGELHTGTTTTNRKVRCVINFNYIPMKLTQ